MSSKRKDLRNDNCDVTSLSLNKNPVHVLCPGPTSSVYTIGQSSVLFVSHMSQLPDQHCPAYWTPNTKYPALFAACAHLWIALLSNLQLPSISGIARVRLSWKHPRWKKLTAGNKGTAVFKEFALKLASLYIYRTAMRKVIDLPRQTDYVSFFFTFKNLCGSILYQPFYFLF